MKGFDRKTVITFELDTLRVNVQITREICSIVDRTASGPIDISIRHGENVEVNGGGSCCSAAPNLDDIRINFLTIGYFSYIIPCVF
jgi:hypothetical protein